MLEISSKGYPWVFVVPALFFITFGFSLFVRGKYLWVDTKCNKVILETKWLWLSQQTSYSDVNIMLTVVPITIPNCNKDWVGFALVLYYRKLDGMMIARMKNKYELINHADGLSKRYGIMV